MIGITAVAYVDDALQQNVAFRRRPGRAQPVNLHAGNSERPFATDKNGHENHARRLGTGGFRRDPFARMAEKIAGHRAAPIAPAPCREA